MNVFYDGRWAKGTGIGRVVDLYVGLKPASVQLHKLDLQVGIVSPLSPLGITRALARHPRSEDSAVFWNPGFVPPLWTTMKTVVTVHDLTHLHYYKSVHRLYYDIVLRPLYRRCDRIICISEHTRSEFLAWSGMSETRVAMVPNAIDPGFADQSPPLDACKPFVFYAGNRRTFKNVPMLVRAFVQSGLPQQGFELVLTGGLDEALRRIVRDAGVEDSLQFRGFLTDAQIVAHYKSASCLAYLSKYEGFGLPILEAWQCGTPVLLANASSLPEVGGDAALYVDPDDLGQIARGMRTLCLDDSVRQSLIARGKKRLDVYDLQRSAATMWRIVKDVAMS